MTTRYLVDPELVIMLDQFPSLELTDENLGQIRDMLEAMNSQMPPNAPEFPDIAVSERFAPGPEGAPDVRMLVYQPTSTQGPRPAMLWIHGGGYVVGTADGEGLGVKGIV